MRLARAPRSFVYTSREGVHVHPALWSLVLWGIGGGVGHGNPCKQGVACGVWRFDSRRLVLGDGSPGARGKIKPF